MFGTLCFVRRALFWLLVIGTLAALATTASARTSRLAKLRVVDVSPLTIAGSGFHRGEHVRITATVASVTGTVRTTATPLGAFRSLLSHLRVSQRRCEAVG